MPTLLENFALSSVPLINSEWLTLEKGGTVAGCVYFWRRNVSYPRSTRLIPVQQFPAHPSRHI